MDAKSVYFWFSESLDMDLEYLIRVCKVCYYCMINDGFSPQSNMWIALAPFFGAYRDSHHMEN